MTTSEITKWLERLRSLEIDKKDEMLSHLIAGVYEVAYQLAMLNERAAPPPDKITALDKCGVPFEGLSAFRCILPVGHCGVHCFTYTR